MHIDLKLPRRTLVAIAAALVLPGAAFAKCGDIKGKGDITIVAPAFPSTQHMAKEMESCSWDGLKVTVKVTPDARVETERAFASDGKSAFDAAIISGGVYSSLASKGQVQPITDLVAKYKARYKLEDGMLVKSNGQVMAVAFQQNAQNLFYRKDVFDKLGLKVPTTYDEMLQAAAVIKAKDPAIDFPIAQTFAKGWDIGAEFINIYIGFGGQLFKPGSAQPAFNSEAGVKTIELMKSMSKFMTPNFLASNSDDVMNQFQQGKAAMGVLWASRAARMDDPAASKIVGKMEFAAAPAAMPGGKSATHLWWDGVALPKNIAGDRDVVFQVLMDALDDESTAAGNDLTIWVRSSYKPTRFGTGVTLSAKAGAPIWPSEPYLGLAHGELGKLVPEALGGTMTPKQALDAAAENYVKAATEKGFIK
ncbi:extracellular solute-binding protein [Comamonadaceae bacterium G21597-S1]|nr:extracellular solute-binding protein [Comamonadaceae bacterium G21597-S1]